MAPIANLTVRISAQIAELQKSFADASKATKQFQDDFAGVATAAATVGTFLGNVFTKIASSIASTLGGAIRDSVKYAQQFQNAFLGLSGVATAFGSSAAAATKAAKSLAADGMLPLSDAATGLKNLLGAGFNLEQSTRLMEAFKDSAAFGRSGALSFGDAVRSATEGVKNQNSVLVDNAGVTKNLSVILKEAGYQLQDLSDKTKGAGARQALYNGILKETAAQTGDAAKASQTYTGALAAMDAGYQSLLAQVGEAITKNKGVQIAMVAVSDAMRGVQGWLGENNKGFDIISTTLSIFIGVIANVIEAFDELQRIMASVDKNIRGSILNLVKGFSEIYIFLQKIEIQTQRPFRAMGGERGAVASQMIEDAKANIRAVEGFAAQMEKDIAATQAQSAKLTSTLTPVVKKLRDVAQAIKDAKGQSVELGASTTPAALDKGGLTQLDKKAEKAKKAFAKLTDEIREMESHATKDIWQMFDPNTVARDTKLAMAQIDQEIANLPGFELKVKQLPIESMFGDPRQIKQWTTIVKSNLDAELKTFKFKSLQDNLVAVFEEIPNIIRNVMSSGGGIIDVMVATASVAGQKFSESFAKAVARSKQPGGAPLTGGEKAMGLAGMGLDSFMGGFAIGASGGKAKGALGGAASGAMQGAMMGSVVPGIGTAIGAVVGGAAGLFGGLFGGSKKAKEDKAALEANKKALAEQYGGMANLRKIAEQLGVSIDKAFNAKKPEQFEAAVNQLNKALEEQKKRLAGLSTAVEGLNTRAALFGQQFAKALEAGDTAKIAEIAQRAQPEFERLGLMVRDTFGGLLKETGNGLEAIQQMAPAFQTLDDGITKFGLTSTAVIDELLENFHLVTNEALKPFFDQLTATGQVLRGLFDAKALSPEGFQAIAADIGASIQNIVDRGGDMARTLALSQPVLQTLWEAQQQYGAVTDETTQAILRQAEEQGIVGAHMKGVNEKILDVLLAIGKVLNADLPQYFDALKKPAADAASSIEDSFSNIRVDPITIPVRYDAGAPPPGMTVPALAGGGIVRRPTLALIGEAGPEAVVPLSGQGLGVEPSSYETTIYLDGEKIARSAAKKLPKFMREMGIGH